MAQNLTIMNYLPIMLEMISYLIILVTNARNYTMFYGRLPGKKVRTKSFGKKARLKCNL
jgi:hypothetical protein